ncbi:hypothetical protein J2847_005625 [Azospirillum agricola]|uniref:hypothetical protein n=1 Tax=Azospirillum agricola TaxID=1720247 RepID=UPI001AE822E4|nr:hypothetical protein [Azospirillum agricola]MBP2232300.1 hypothetical protein [Azospirillum agricola]
MRIAAITAPPVAKPPRTGPRGAARRHARLCYHHLAGGLGVAITDALLARGVIEFDDGAVGAALCAHLLERDVIRRSGESRTLSTTPRGRAVPRDLFGIGAPADAAAF